jgi:ferredoxin-type protein NapH
MRVHVRQRTFLCVTLTVMVCLLVLIMQNTQLANGCYGPHITAQVDKTTLELNGTVTVTGMVCPAEYNKSVRVDFTKPDYTYIDLWTTTDENGNFSITQQLDMVGYWNIFAIDGHMCDRLHVIVSDPANPQAPVPTPIPLPPYKPNYSVIAVASVGVGIAVAAVAFGRTNRTRKISSLRLFVQIAFVFLIFIGMFIDHQNLPIPAEQISPHEVLVATSMFGVHLPDGIPVPFFGCYYPCGKTVTCALWELQTYIYPFSAAGRGWGVEYYSSGLARLAVVFGVVIFSAVLLGRAFCGWICPFGLYTDLMTRLRKALRIKHRNFSDKFNQRFHQLSYVILALIIVLSVVFASQAITGTQVVAGTEKGGFVYNYLAAPFCQVCPMKPLCLLAQTSVGLMKPEWVTANTAGIFYEFGYYLTSTNIIILGVVTAAAFFFRRSWCRICPLGGMMALFNRFPPFKWISGVRLDKAEEKCTKCGICKRVCPTQVKEVYEQKSGDVASSQCIYCLRCVEMCPYEDCLKFKFAGKTVCKSRNWLNTSDRKVND